MNKIFKPNKISNWVISNLPENYTQMEYVEPFTSNVFFAKLPSISETINELNIDIVQILRALKDEPEEFINKLKSITCSENVFKRELKKNDYDDYFQHAVSKFIIMRMSKNCNKKKFEEINWKEVVVDLHATSQRLNNVIILNKKPANIVNFFDNKNSLIYCCPPASLSTDETIELSEHLNRCHGKVILTAESSALYNRLYTNWKCQKKKKECLWKNW